MWKLRERKMWRTSIFFKNNLYNSTSKISIRIDREEMDEKRKDTDVTAKRKIERRKTRKPEKRQKDKGRRIRGWEGRAHSLTMLHYVRHFPEDSLGSENREDVGKRWGVGARGRPNKYLTKSSGKLIPSFGRLLRGAPSTAARRRRARTDPAFHFAIFLVRFRERIGRNHDPAKLGDERRKHWNVRITRARDSLSAFHSSRGINVPRNKFRLTPRMLHLIGDNAWFANR